MRLLVFIPLFADEVFYASWNEPPEAFYRPAYRTLSVASLAFFRHTYDPLPRAEEAHHHSETQ
jgi:hypothetical protein